MPISINKRKDCPIMPKKSKKTTKKVSKKVSKSCMPCKSCKNGSVRANHLKDQENFYKAHPNAKPLLTSFLILVLLMGALYYLQFGFELMPQ